jgi:hypothetical protein
MRLVPTTIRSADQRNTYNFQIAHLRVAVSGPSALVDALRARLCLLRSAPTPTTDLVFDFQGASATGGQRIEPPHAARLVCQAPGIDVLYSDHDNCVYITLADTICACCDARRGYIRASFFKSHGWELWALSHILFNVSLIEMLKHHGLYSIHAAGIASDDRGILLAGPSGAGKSALALALVRAGFGFLGDDTLFLAPGPDGTHAIAFPDEVDVTDNTISLFPELSGLLGVSNALLRPKRSFRAEAFYGAPMLRECRPTVLVFRRVAGTDQCRLVPVARAEAFLELAPNVLLTDAAASHAHLDALAALTRQCACYRLETGRDLKSMPQLLTDLVS